MNIDLRHFNPNPFNQGHHQHAHNAMSLFRARFLLICYELTGLGLNVNSISCRLL